MEELRTQIRNYLNNYLIPLFRGQEANLPPNCYKAKEGKHILSIDGFDREIELFDHELGETINILNHLANCEDYDIPKICDETLELLFKVTPYSWMRVELSIPGAEEMVNRSFQRQLARQGVPRRWFHVTKILNFRGQDYNLVSLTKKLKSLYKKELKEKKKITKDLFSDPHYLIMDYLTAKP